MRLYFLGLILIAPFFGFAQLADPIVTAIKSNSHDPAEIEKLVKELERDSSIHVYRHRERPNYLEQEEIKYTVQTGKWKYFITYEMKNGQILSFEFRKRNDLDQRYETLQTYGSRIDRYSVYDNYGISWGLGSWNAETYKPMIDVFRFVETKSIDSLKKMCVSLCNETRAYGATGLYLISQVEPSNNNLLELFENIRCSDLRINFPPGGCVIFGDELISNALTNEFMIEVYNTYLLWQKKKQ